MNYDFNNPAERIRIFDESVLIQLFDKLYSPLCYYSFQITKDFHLSKELVQDVFLKVWQKRNMLIFEASLKSYLFQAVRNMSINERKKRNASKYSTNKTAPDEIWKYIYDHAESHEYIIELITSADTEKSIQEAVNSLPAICKSVFLLSRMENKSNKEIAQIMNISVNTVRAHIFHALEKISIVLEKEK